MNAMNTDKISVLRTALVLFVLAFWNCSSSTEIGNPNDSQPSVSGHESEAALETTIKSGYIQSVTPAPMYEMATLAATAGDDGTEAHLRTSVNLAGVDEPDVVKSDGAHFFIAKDNAVVIARYFPDMEFISSFTLPGLVTSLALHEDLMVVLFIPPGLGGSDWEYDEPPGGARIGLPYWRPVNAGVGVAIYCVADPQNPEPLKSFEIQGTEVASRLINGKFYLVQQFLPNLPPDIQFWYYPTAEDLNTILENNAGLINGLELRDLVPAIREVYPEPEEDPRPLVPPQRFYRLDDVNSGGSITTMSFIDLTDPDFPVTGTGLVADAQAVYANDRSLYIAARSWRTIDPNTDAVAQETLLFKFDLTGGAARPAAVGYAPGWILNHLSMDEQDNVLRLASATETASEPQTRAEHVYCLAPVNEVLKIVGRLENIITSTSIYSARFVGHRGYLTNFLSESDTTSPLHVLDLARPQAPVIASRLDLPGRVNHIYPIGENGLLAAGIQVIDDGSATLPGGLQLSLVDISDIYDPRRLDEEQIGVRGTTSEALFNHKAFAYDAGASVMALPVALFEHVEDPPEPLAEGAHTYNGLYVYRISALAGFEFLGSLDTSLGQDPALVGLPWTRGRFQQPDVQAVTPLAVHAAPMDNIGEPAEPLPLPGEPL